MTLKRNTHWKKTPKKNKKVNKESASYLKKKADNVYSRWLRLSFADKQGMVRCYTCPAIKHWKEMQCSHYVSRSYNALRYDPRNTKPACPGCNIWKQGNLDEYALHLIEEYGQNILNELNEEKKKLTKMTAQDYKNIINTYEEKLVPLEKSIVQ